MSNRKVGEVLADMILFGDIEEAPWLPEWYKDLEKQNIDCMKLSKTDPELFHRLNIAATLLKLTNNMPGGSCSIDDKLIKPYLQQEVKPHQDH